MGFMCGTQRRGIEEKKGHSLETFGDGEDLLGMWRRGMEKKNVLCMWF